MEKFKVLDLFSGVGGFSLGLERSGMETLAFCEIDEFCQKVLNKNFPNKKIFTDIKKLTKEEINELGRIDVVCGGFPCQPFSIAGQKKGIEDDRDLWPEMFRVIQTARPTWVIGENVANFINMEFTRTKIDLESIGYKVQPFVIPACAVGAHHRRDRVWIIAHLDRPKLREQSVQLTKCQSERFAGYNGEKESSTDTDSNGHKQDSSLQTRDQGARSGNIRNGPEGTTANPDSNGLNGETNATEEKNYKRIWQDNGWTETSSDFGYWWADQSRVGRAIYGFSKRVDKYRKQRIKSLGNAVVPLIPEIIGRAILKTKESL